MKPLVLLVPIDNIAVQENVNEEEEGTKKLETQFITKRPIKDVIQALGNSKETLLKENNVCLRLCSGAEIISKTDLESDESGKETLNSMLKYLKLFEKEKIKRDKKDTDGGVDTMKVVILYDFPLSKAQFSVLVESDDKNPVLDGFVDFPGFEESNTMSSEEEDRLLELYPDILTHSMLSSFIAMQTKEKEGLWNDITTTTITLDLIANSYRSIRQKELEIENLRHQVEEIRNPPAPAVDPTPVKGKGKVAAAAPIIDENKIKELETTIEEISNELVDLNSQYSACFGEICPQFGPLLWSMAKEKADFQAWAGDEKTVVAFDAAAFHDGQLAVFEASQGINSGVWKSKELYAKYVNTIENFPSSMQDSGAVLYSIVRSIVNPIDSNTWAPSPLNHALVQEGLCKVILESRETGKLCNLSALYQDALSDYSVRQDAIVCDEGNELLMNLGMQYPSAKDRNLHKSEIDRPSLHGFVSFLKHAKFRGQICRILGEGRFPRYSKMTSVERCVQETELLSFTSLSIRDFFRSHQLHEFQRMLADCATKLEDFTGSLKRMAGVDSESATQRKYFRAVCASTFQQIYANYLLREPDIVRQYYPMTDDMLLIFHWQPPPRRMIKRTWDASMSVRMRQSFKEYGKLKLLSQGKPLEKPPPCISITKKELMHYRRDTSFITPAGKSMAFIHKLASSGDSWITVLVDDAVIGLRKHYSISRPEPLDSGRKQKSTKTLKKVKSGAGRGNDESGIDHSGSTVSRDSPTQLREEPSLTSLSTAALSLSVCSSASFFCHIHDSRFVITSSSPSSLITKKPDGKGTVCLTGTFSNGLTVSVSSDNTVKVAHIMHPEDKQAAEYVGTEVYRTIAAGGVVTRHLVDSPFALDIYHPSGARTLIRGGSCTNPSLKGFFGRLLSEAPDNWTYVRFEPNGKVHFFSCPPGTEPEKHGHTPSSLKNIAKVNIDAQTKATVTIFRDGRHIINYVDQLTWQKFPDGTTFTVHPSKSHLCIQKTGHPTVEIDCLNDKICRGHAQGQQIPLSKGGERIRSLISCPDGSAVIVKYDITVTAKVNGSLKLVGRDRTVIKAIDGGEVVYVPRTSWNQQAEHEFAKECKDTSTPVTSNAEKLSTFDHDFQFEESMKKKSNPIGGTAKTVKDNIKKETSGSPPDTAALVKKLSAKETFYNFNVDKLTCHIQDYEYNHFYIDLSEQRNDSLSPNDPLSPTLKLAGEVEGLRPQAVTDKPIEPKLFVVHRNGDAVEIISSQDFEEKQRFCEACPDASFESTDMIGPPCDLGGGRLHCFRHRRRRGVVGDLFLFSDVFGNRSWHKRSLPPTAELLTIGTTKHEHNQHHGNHIHDHHPHKSVIKHNGSKRDDESVLTVESEDQELLAQRLPRIYESLKVEEHPPLSVTGYNQLLEDLKSWQMFRRKRAESIDRFAVEDLRPADEIDLDEKVKAKLKVAYKNAKIARQRNREKAREAARAAAEAARTNPETAIVGGSSTIDNAGKTALGLQLKKLSLDAIGEEGEEEEVEFSDEEPEEYEDPINIEITAAFESFAFKDTDLIEKIMVKDVRAALVQLFNCKVTEEFVTEVLEQESLSRAIKSFDFEDFSRIYYSAFRAVSMRPEVADGLVEESTHELQSPIQLEEETSTTFTSLPVGSGMQVARKIVIDK